jgi:hypothetical protein
LPKEWKWSWDRQLRNADLWNTFHEVVDPQGLPGVKCKRCRQAFKHPGLYPNGSFSTSALTRHQKSCGTSKVSGNVDQRTNNIPELFQKQSNSESDTRDSITEDNVKDAVLDFFIAGNIPFNQADSPQFQKMISMIRVKGRPVTINRKNVRRRLSTRASEAKQDLMNELAANSSRCSLALDGWTSRMNNSYMGMTLAACKSDF